MKKHLLFIFAALLPLLGSAHDFEFDGIYYNITSEAGKTAEVTFKGDSYDNYDDEYSGSITIPATVTYNGAAYSVTSIGEYAFYDCSRLTAITIPEGVTSIGESAFRYCSSLTSITIPEGVTSIGYSAFAYCSSLTAINIPEGVTSIGGYAFEGTSWYNNQPDGIVYVGNILYHYKGTMPQNTSIEVREGTVSISPCAFEDCSSLTAINIPEGVTSIGVGAFWGCSSLTAINIPESLTSIDNNAFEGTSWYNNQPDGIVYVGNILYHYKGTMPQNTSIEVREGTVSISPYAFYWCENLTTITIPESVTSIGECAFWFCTSLTAINIPEGVTSIESYTFSDCNSLTAINIPEGVTSIGRSAFSSCISLTTITLPEGVTSIGRSAFSWCSRLTAINIPEGVTSIEERVFWICSSLTSITLPEGVTSIGDYAFEDCSRLTAINIPEGVTSIGNDAFANCRSLTAINIPNGVTELLENTFYRCTSFKELTLGKGLKKITAGAFTECTALEKITIHATQPPTTDGNIFSDATYENATLYVPQGSIAKYQVMTGWRGFYNISEMEGGTPDYLTLRQADNGEIRIAVDLGRTYQMQIVPSTGWKIHTVTFDGKDMTAQLAADNTFTTPTINGSAVLNVAYVKEGTAIAAATASRIKVQGHQGTISIAGATEGEAIGLYTTSGTLVATATAEGDTTHLTVPTGQVYIVKVADTVVKIGM